MAPPGKPLPAPPHVGGGTAMDHSQLTPQEQQPILVIHVDVDNALILASRCALDLASAEKGLLQATTVKRYASHVLAEAATGTINPNTSEWTPTLASETLTEDESITFADYQRLLHKNAPGPESNVSDLADKIQTFGWDVKIKRRARRGSANAGGDASEAAAAAIRDFHRLIIRRLMLPPTVCMALGCESPDPNIIIGGSDGNQQRSSFDSGDEPQGTQQLRDVVPQLRLGYWRLAPSFLSLLFGLARIRRPFRLVFHTRHQMTSEDLASIQREFNDLCEGRHPAFNGDNRTKQVFFNGTHNCVDLRISKDCIGVLSYPPPRDTVEGEAVDSSISGAQTQPRLQFPSTGRTYEGAHQIYTGIMFQELSESRVIFVVHELQQSSARNENCGDADNSGAQAEPSPRKSPAESLSCTEQGPPRSGTAELVGPATPLTVWVDGQDFTFFHVCLSSAGTPTVADGIVHLRTLRPVDVVTEEPVALHALNRVEEPCQPVSKVAAPVSLRTSGFTRGRYDCNAAVCRVSPSLLESITSSDCLMTGIEICEEERLNLILGQNEERTLECNINQASVDGPDHSGRTDGVLSRLDAVVEQLFGPKPTPDHAHDNADVQYLMETIVPVLYPAVEVVLRDRLGLLRDSRGREQLRDATDMSHLSFCYREAWLPARLGVDCRSRIPVMHGGPLKVAVDYGNRSFLRCSLTVRRIHCEPKQQG